MIIYDSKYDKSIVFIERDGAGQRWTNQVNGCACWHPELTGFVRVLVEDNDFSCKWFNPDFWYKLWHRENGFIHEEHIKEINFEGITVDSWFGFFHDYKQLESEPEYSPMEYQEQEKWRMENDPIFSELHRKMDKLEEMIQSSENFFSYEKINQEMEFALNKIKAPDMEFIKIIKPFPESVEAWVEVEVTYKNGARKTGVVTWENCD